MDESVYAALEWDRVVRAVRSRCVGPTQSHEDLPIARDAQATRVALEETAEAIQFLEQGDPVPVEGIKDIALSLSRVARDGALSGIELRDVGLTLAAARVLRKFLGRNRAHVPHLTAACPIDPTLDDLEDHIAHVIERDGKVSDHATPELRALRTEVANVRARLVGRLEELLRQHAVALQDSYYTVREGRYVLPMRADAHDRIQGIVHGTSASGATVFIEPRAIISYGNRLKIAEGEMEREEQRILLAVTDRVRGSLPTVLAAFDALNHADLRAASAKFARDFGARVVRLEDGARMRLVRVRHPVLAIDGGSVVPNDVEVASGHALVISGPNAGGKTVALKTVGLAALMVRAGLPLMAEDGSVAAFFDPVMADVGDAQSIAKNLSTFSAHVRNVARMLAASGPRALVLLDELAGGTDPSEGAALACALVDAFTAKGAAVIVTTHYEALKARGLAAPTLRNASVGFDVATLAPTFELLLDVPGGSSALVVAERFGIPTGVIAAARDFVPEQVRSLESLVTDVRERMRSVAEEREALALERAKVEREHGALREEREKYRARDQKGLSEGAAELAAEMERTKKELAEARRALRDAPPSDDTIRTARAALDAAEGARRDAQGASAPSTANPDASGEGTSSEHLVPGVRVRLRTLGQEGEVTQVTDKGKVQVAVGAVKLWASIADVVPLGKRKDSTTTQPAVTRPRGATIPTSDNTLDVRGMRVDEALPLVESYIDRRYATGEGVIYLHHGVGTGALRDAIRELLKRNAHYACTVRAGTADEGGDRFTVIEF